MIAPQKNSTLGDSSRAVCTKTAPSEGVKYCRLVSETDIKAPHNSATQLLSLSASTAPPLPPTRPPELQIAFPEAKMLISRLLGPLFQLCPGSPVPPEFKILAPPDAAIPGAPTAECCRSDKPTATQFPPSPSPASLTFSTPVC